MQANKQPGHKIPEDSKGMYHIQLLKRSWDEKNKTQIEGTHVAIMSPKDYQNFKKPGMQEILGYSEATILHDPTMKDKEITDPEQPEAEIETKSKGGRPPKK